MPRCNVESQAISMKTETLIAAIERTTDRKVHNRSTPRGRLKAANQYNTAPNIALSPGQSRCSTIWPRGSQAMIFRKLSKALPVQILWLLVNTPLRGERVFSTRLTSRGSWSPYSKRKSGHGKSGCPYPRLQEIRALHRLVGVWPIETLPPITRRRILDVVGCLLGWKPH